jgi:hypothetical protein
MLSLLIALAPLTSGTACAQAPHESVPATVVAIAFSPPIADVAPAAQPALTGQQGALAAPQKYKLTILESAPSSRRVKKGRVSSQAVIKVTDENDVPVAGIAVSFMLPQISGGASFASGGLTSVVTTNAAGIASSGTFSAAAGSTFSVSVSASVPGGAVVTGAVPISTSAAAAGAGAGAGAAGATTAAAGAGHLALIIGVAAAAVAGGVGAAVALSARTTNNTSTATPTVGSAVSITFGGPK